MTIVNIRGTNGSGKSTIAHEILSKWPKEVAESEGVKIRAYKVKIPGKIPLFIIGSYKTQCGGCDGISEYAKIWPLVFKYAALGHVLFEGVLVSSSYGNIGRASEVFGDKFIFAFLDTPLETCIKRVEARRKKKGNLEPLDPTNLTQKWHSVDRSISKIKELGRRVEIINHRKAFAEVCGLLGVKI